jgi:drug/metabolite transporter (DMT)-like permease
MAAALWAAGGIVYAANIRRLGPVTLNLIRTLGAFAFVCLLVPISHSAGDFRNISAPTLIAMFGSGILAMALGDLLFFYALPTLGASLSVPISSSVYPIATFFVAVLWLDETITATVFLGSALIIAGIFLLVWHAEPSVRLPEPDSPPPVFSFRNAVLMLMIATVFWTASTTWIRAASGDISAVPATVLRTAAASLFLLPVFALRRSAEPQRPSPGVVAALAIAGVFAIGIGGLFYVQAVQEAGAGRTAVLTSTMPLFNLPLAIFFLRERVTPRLVLGTITCVAGIFLVI